MNFLKKLSFTNLVVYISFIFAFLLIFVWFFETSINSKKEIEEYQELQLKQKKELVKKEVLSAVDYINYKKLNTEKELKNILKDKIYDAHSIALNIYNKFKDTKTKEEIIFIIKESLRNFKFFNNRGYFFILDLNGSTILHPIFPQHEGTNFLRDFQDIKGVNLHNKFKQIALSKDSEGYITYNFFRTVDKTKEAKKIGFIKLFEPYGLYIGTAEYVEDYEKTVKNEIFNRLKEIRFDANGYIFVTGFNGVALMNPMRPEIVGKNFLDFKDKNGKYPVREFIKLSKKDGGFVFYTWPKPGTNELIEKFVYVKGIKDWNWIISGGNYLDDIKVEIFYKSLQKKQEQRDRISTTGIILVILLIISLIFMAWWNKRIRASINKFIYFFEDASKKNVRINVDDVSFQEFKKMAVCINSMLESKEELQKKLKKLAITDSLTNLNNRMKIDEILSGEISRSERFNHTFTFAILDIDYFKNVNDTYGHQMGDKVLMELAKILKNNIRKVDFVGRWGGEEFVIICPQTSINGSSKMLEKIRKKIESTKIDKVKKITVSFGLTSYKSKDTEESVLKRADRALYEAKDSGRNRIVIA